MQFLIPNSQARRLEPGHMKSALGARGGGARRRRAPTGPDQMMIVHIGEEKKTYTQ